MSSPSLNSPDPSYWQGRSIVVTGGAGFLGTQTVELLKSLGARIRVPRSRDHDLRVAVAACEAVAGAEVVIHLAGIVGGIGFGRRHPALLVHDNVLIAANVFEACRKGKVQQLIAPSSVCAYPLDAPVPFQEKDIWDGYPETTNAPYGLAKKMHLVLSSAYRAEHGLESCVPVLANLYGPGGNFDPDDSHVIAAMTRKFSEATSRGDEVVRLWGTGKPSREFLHTGDAARALLLCGEHLRISEPVNIGTGVETPNFELADLISGLCGFQGTTVWDTSFPDGQPRRSLDVSRARELVGFEAVVPIEQGLAQVRDSYLGNRISRALP